MSTTIKMPQLGESVTEGTIERWLVKVGDQVAQYDPLFEVVTDKVNAEVPAEVGGVVTSILVPDGETGKGGRRVGRDGGGGGGSGGDSSRGASSRRGSSRTCPGRRSRTGSAAECGDPPAAGRSGSRGRGCRRGAT